MAQNPLIELFHIIEKGYLEKDIPVQYGNRTVVFRLRSLFDEDYTWRDRFINMDNALTMATSMRVPTLAIATVAIDNVPVADVEDFLSDKDVPAGIRETYRHDVKFTIAYNVMRKYEKFPRELVNELYKQYTEQIESVAQNVTGESIKNS